MILLKVLKSLRRFADHNETPESRPAPSTIFNNSILYVLIPPNLKMVLGDWIIQKLIKRTKRPL